MIVIFETMIAFSDQDILKQRTRLIIFIINKVEN